MQSPFVRRPIHRGLLVSLFVAMASGSSFASEDNAGNDDSEPARIYSTPAERREAGVKHQLLENLTLSILAEFEYVGDRYRPLNLSSRIRDHDFGKTLQMTLAATPRPWLGLELVYQYEADRQSERHSVDEAIASVKVADFEGEFGKLYLPFGVYFSRFVSGPLLEFGETRAQGAVFSYSPENRLHSGVFLYRGKKDTGWGLVVEGSAFAFLKVGGSYLSDLADAKQGLSLCGNDGDCRRVAGASAYAVAASGQVEVTAEFLTALRSFAQPGADGTRPRAWNVEVALLPQADLSVALRLEGSADLEGAPSHRTGASLAWRVARNASVTLEYLHSRGIAEDASRRVVDRGDRVGAQLSLAF